MTLPAALVTGSGSVTGLNVVRALTADGAISVVGCDLESWNPADRYCRNFVVPPARDTGYLPRILEIANAHGVTAIIPTNDHEVRALATQEDALTAAGIRLNARCANQLAFLDKGATTDLFMSHGVDTPREVPFDCRALPIVVRKRRMGEGPKLVRIVRTQRECAELAELSRDEVIATEFIEGDEFTVDILSDDQANVLAVVPRLRRVVRHGIVLFGEIVRDETVIGSATALARQLGLTGVNCVQCIRREKRCSYFEVNPRPGSGIDLTVAGGVNMPALWVRVIHGERVQIPEPEWGLKLVRTYDGYFFR